jgi:DNA-binding transcriptional MocR family regulator
VWIPVPDETTVVARLLAEGWVVAPGSPFRLHAAPAVRVTAALLPVADAPALADALAAALNPAGPAGV